jgi:hypothetical protein
MESMFTFNYLAIVSAAVASFVLGGVWAALFGRQLARLTSPLGTETQAKQQPSPRSLVGIFIANLIMAFGLAYFIRAIGTNNALDALWLTLWSFIAFVGPLTIGPVLWEGRSIGWWISNNVINIICLFTMVLILTFWH